ncbi:hypothetical protein [Hymenobacter sp. AT01-02]|uniref:hypothetical protein n=1 Tax=Hymenobacter sp. AT01-02 TaxID=1571877 RepID=UPI0006E2F13E|nr:hypothetical protein [Hymenobacter sp. AT01-02]
MSRDLKEQGSLIHQPLLVPYLLEKLSPFAVYLALLSGINSCGSDRSDPTPAQDKVALLTTKKWRVTAQLFSEVWGGQTLTHDDYADLKPCALDNFVQFTSDKAVVFDEGATKCDPTTAQAVQGVWDFNREYTTLTLSDGKGSMPVVYEVLELSSTTLHWKIILPQGTNQYILDQTFTAF